MERALRQVASTEAFIVPGTCQGQGPVVSAAASIAPMGRAKRSGSAAYLQHCSSLCWQARLHSVGGKPPSSPWDVT